MRLQFLIRLRRLPKLWSWAFTAVAVAGGLSLADLALTIFALRMGAFETNPLGFNPAFKALTVLFLIAVAFACLGISRTRGADPSGIIPSFLLFGSGVMAVIYVVVVANNLLWLLVMAVERLLGLG